MKRSEHLARRWSPTAARWRALDWPGPARWGATLSFFCAVNWMLLAPAKTFRDLHVLLACQDKIAHAAIFLTLALLVRWSLPAAWAGGWQRAAVLGAVALYAGSIELFQPLLAKAGRQFEWLDMASNFSGAGAGWLLGGLLVARAAGEPPAALDEAAPAFAGAVEGEP